MKAVIINAVWGYSYFEWSAPWAGIQNVNSNKIIV